ncbi:MAG: hypothetical protein P4M11_01230 [Candidatus Pacebacteria bacterium]|nr:hypothetical protein [Candidatus Paceibacterota bacterium]
MISELVSLNPEVRLEHVQVCAEIIGFGDQLIYYGCLKCRRKVADRRIFTKCLHCNIEMDVPETFYLVNAMISDGTATLIVKIYGELAQSLFGGILSVSLSPPKDYPQKSWWRSRRRDRRTQTWRRHFTVR